MTEGAGPSGYPEATDFRGRRVVFDDRSRRHLHRRRPWLLDHLNAILATLEIPDHHTEDPYHAGRERFYRQDLAARRWLRVVVDFNDIPAWVVTVAVQTNDPR